MRAVFNTAVDDELIRRNPCRIRGAGQAPTAGAANGDACPRCSRIAAEISAATARSSSSRPSRQLRFGELMGLRREISTCRKRRRGTRPNRRKAVAQLNSGTQRIKGPKSEAGTGTIVLPAAILPDLRASTWRLRGTRRRPGGCSLARKEAPPRRSNFNRIWKRALRDAGANPELHLHDLRHTGGTLVSADRSDAEGAHGPDSGTQLPVPQ